MPGRKYSATSNYRYGFNGKENDNEVKGEGNQQDYGLRIYDARLGKFLSVDPLAKKYPGLSPYPFAENSPILHVDLDGGEKKPYFDLPKHSANTQLEVINHINVFTFTELGTQYKVAEYGTQLKDPGPFSQQYSRSIYMVKDEKVVNNSDYLVGDGTIIRTKGTNWHFWKTSNDRSTAGQVTDDLLKKTGITVFGAAAVGTALPAAVNMAPAVGKFLIGRVTDPSAWGNAIGDWGAQKLNGSSNGQLNLTSIAANFLLPGKLNTFLAPTLGSAFEYSTDAGFRNSYVFGQKSTLRFGLETTFGILGNGLANKYGGPLGKYLKGGGADAATRFGLETVGNAFPNLITNGASGTATNKTDDKLEPKK